MYEYFQAFHRTGLSRARTTRSSPSERAWARGQHRRRHRRLRNERASPPATTSTTSSQDRRAALRRGTESSGARAIPTKTRSAFIIATWTSSGSTRRSECALLSPFTFKQTNKQTSSNKQTKKMCSEWTKCLIVKDNFFYFLRRQNLFFLNNNI